MDIYLNEMQLIEADGDIAEEKSIFEVVMIRPGLSLNGKFYSEDLLRAALPLFEGVRSMARSDDEHMWGGGKLVKNIVGFFSDVEFREGVGIVGNFNVMPSAAWLSSSLRFAIVEGKPDLFGFSIVAQGIAHHETVDGQFMVVVDIITDVSFVDVVVDPGAGGEVLSELDAVPAGSDDDMAEATICTQASLTYSDARVAELALEEALSRDMAGFDRSDLLESVSNGFVVQLAESAGISELDRRRAVSQRLDPTYQEMKMREKLLKMIESKRPDIYGTLDVENVTEAELENIVQGLIETTPPVDPTPPAGITEGAPATPPLVPPAVPLATPTAASSTMVEAQNRIAVLESTMNQSLALLQRQTSTFELREAIAREELPGDFAENIQARLQREIDAGVSVTPTMIAEAIKEQRKLVESLTKSGIIVGEGRLIEMRESETDKAVQMINDFFDPVKGEDISFKEAYINLTGDTHVTGRPEKRHWEAMQNYCEAHFPDALREAVTTGAFDLILGDTLNREMVAQYANFGLNDWEALTRITNSSDFRPQHRVRFGGYPNLPTVAENNAYTALTTPTEEEVTYSVVKRGGTETITIEAIANDDVGLVREIPIGLGRSAAQTLHEFVLDFLDTNPTIYDATALFTSGHGNLNTVAFSETEYLNVRRKMRDQKRLSNDKHIGVFAKHIWAPADLESAVFDAFRRDTNNDPNFSQTVKPMVHIVDYWTDTNNWYVTADKSSIPMIELSFWGGRNPSLFVQDNPTQGSMFSRDARTYKMRHVYNAAIIEFRGFQGSLVP